jgi:hypothetical protein
MKYDTASGGPMKERQDLENPFGEVRSHFVAEPMLFAVKEAGQDGRWTD